MALKDQNPAALSQLQRIDWSVDWINQLKGQVWGIIQNGGGGGGGTQDLESVLSYGNNAFNQSIILEGNDYSQITISGAPDSSYVEIISPDSTNGLFLFVNDTYNYIQFVNDGNRLQLEAEGPVTSNETVKIPITTGTIALQEWVNSNIAAKLNIDGSNAMTGVLDFGTFKGINLATPTDNNDATNKLYVDTFVTGLSPKTAVRVATTAPLIGLYDNATGTIAITATGVLAVDGVNLVQGNRVLIKNQVSQIENGIYDVTTEGILGVATIFTRSSDANTGAELVSAYTYTGAEGISQANKGYVQATPATIVIGISNIIWNLFNSNTYSAGTGIRIGASNIIYSKLSEGVAGGQAVIGGTAADDTLNVRGSISTDSRTTTLPAISMTTWGALGGTSGGQVFISAPVNINASGTAGYTAIKVPVTETSVGSGTKNFIEFLGGTFGNVSKFSIANTGTITVAPGANRFANDVSAITVNASFTLGLIQNETWIRTGFTVPRVVVVPTDSDTPFPIGAQINIAQWADGGTTRIQAFDATVTIRSKGGFKTINGQYVWVTLKKVDTNEWALIGDLIA